MAHAEGYGGVGWRPAIGIQQAIKKATHVDGYHEIIILGIVKKMRLSETQ